MNSSPSGIQCTANCNANFNQGTAVTLTATAAAGSNFVGWGGSCTGSNSTCSLTLTTNTQVTATFNLAQGVNLLNHIIFMAQENRSFDHYFGALAQYWAQNGYPAQQFDGLPQFSNPPGPAPSNPGCNPADPYSPPPAPFQDCVFDTSAPVTSYHLITQCIENPSPFWNESHVDWDYNDQTDTDPYVGNGFVWDAAHDARAEDYFNNNPRNDTGGIRTMGYYDGTDLNYYYFMASNFATSDRWFNPEMTRTEPNRNYLLAATSQGYVFPNGTNQNDQNPLTATNIFQELQSAGITWKIYVNPDNSPCSGPPYQASCLVKLSSIYAFAWSTTLVNQYPGNLATIGVANSDWDNDIANGTLPQVAIIEDASYAGLDEHPSDYDTSPINIQLGAQYVSGIINQLMTSSSWKDSAFILTWDEYGGLYDHVSPQPEPSPDGIPPVDLYPTDICYGTPNIGTCNFTWSGYRIPLIVVSPYTKKNYVDHTVSDSTAWLKLVETRFNLAPLTNRDAAQPDMTQFFDFNNPPWMTPPTPPVQYTNGQCYLDHLP